MKKLKYTILVMLIFLGISSANHIFANHTVILIDCSESMSDSYENETKMEIAKNFVLSSTPYKDDNTAIFVLGRYDSCDATLIKDFNDESNAIDRKISNLIPMFRTPIAEGIDFAKRLMKDKEGKKNIILVTDGLESCNGDFEEEVNKSIAGNVNLYIITVTDDEKLLNYYKKTKAKRKEIKVATVKKAKKIIAKKKKVKKIVKKPLPKPAPVKKIVNKPLPKPAPVKKIVKKPLPKPTPVKKIVKKPLPKPAPVKKIVKKLEPKPKKIKRFNLKNKIKSRSHKIEKKTPKLLNKEKIKYPKIALKMKLEGSVNLKLYINEFGKVQNVKVNKSSGSRYLDTSAKKIVKNWKFTPASINGKKIKSILTKTIIFRLDRSETIIR